MMEAKKKRIMDHGLWIMGFVSCVLCLALAAPLYCAEVSSEEELDEFIYDSKGKRDPFVPLITEKMRFSIGLAGIESIEDIALEGIVWDAKGGSLAILNGIIMTEGEEIGNVKLAVVEPERITLIINNKVYNIELVKEERDDDKE